MLLVWLLLVGALLCVVLSAKYDSKGKAKDQEVIGLSTQHGWVQRRGPSAVNRSSRNVHRM